MVGLLRAVESLAVSTGRQLVADGRIITPSQDGRGVDIVVATSSAGGGLQMLVAGIIGSMTAESAHRAALGAGAIVTDVLSIDDDRTVMERIRRLKEFRPDMILVAGGTDAGNVSHVAAIAEWIAAAQPEPRFRSGFPLPVIYAGNVAAREYVLDALADRMDVRVIENLRPSLEAENLVPARQAIHEVFLEHVMAHAPGYQELLAVTNRVILPTPMGTGRMLQRAARELGRNLVALDIGGATTDIFSLVDGVYHRTVSANLGMSYSAANVVGEAGIEAITHWLPYPADGRSLQNWVGNKMIRPTTLPESLEELLLEHAVAREAIRLSFAHHLSLAVGLKGVQQRRVLDDFVSQTAGGRQLFGADDIGAIVGSGGVLSNAPRRAQAMLILIDALQPVGVFDIYVDSVFMLPQLGALAEVDETAAVQALLNDCLLPLGPVIATRETGTAGTILAEVTVEGRERREERQVIAGALDLVALAPGEEALVRVKPRVGVDCGAGRGRALARRVRGGEVGLVLDGRGRPIGGSGLVRRQQMADWMAALDAYPATGPLAAEGGVQYGGRS